jgi:hypothetical protein
MKTRTLGIVAVVLFALGAFATGATAAKPRLWLIDVGSHVRATTGEAARIQLTMEFCRGSQSASVISNGKPVDHIAGAGSLASVCETGAKEVGAIKSIAIAAAPENLMTMTVTGVVHLGIEPWCTYTLPHKITGAEFFFSEMFAAVTATLDKAASFGSCAPAREMSIGITVEQLSEQFPYAGEVVG